METPAGAASPDRGNAGETDEVTSARQTTGPRVNRNPAVARELYDGRELLGRIAGAAGGFLAALADGTELGTFARIAEAEAAILDARRKALTI